MGMEYTYYISAIVKNKNGDILPYGVTFMCDRKINYDDAIRSLVAKILEANDNFENIVIMSINLLKRKFVLKRGF